MKKNSVLPFLGKAEFYIFDNSDGEGICKI